MSSDLNLMQSRLPIGFSAYGINCGVKRTRLDLGVVVSEKECDAAGVFTQNRCAAAHVQYCRQILPTANILAIITNSGEANAATGINGSKDNQKMAEFLACELKCLPTQILTASTGVIGCPLSLEKIRLGLPKLIKRRELNVKNFSQAILTTDLVPKVQFREVQLSSGKISISGVCKGSGMIHPNMATMLGYFFTDAKINFTALRKILGEITAKSFNMISVDGETSTNDSLFIMANGMSGVEIKDGSLDMDIFYQTVLEVAIHLAKSIVRDGEGASKLIEVDVSGVKSKEQARKIARSITTSPLIKSAIYGKSPNWGRIIARIGNEKISHLMLDQCDISMQGVRVFSKGLPERDIDLQTIKTKFAEDIIKIEINFNAGDFRAIAWGCDLTEEYVKINADYIS